MADLVSKREWEEIRIRLVATRCLISGDNQSAFARKLGMHPNRWNNYERGAHPTLRVIMQIERQTSVPVEYIIFGKIERVKTMRRKLVQLERSISGCIDE